MFAVLWDAEFKAFRDVFWEEQSEVENLKEGLANGECDLRSGDGKADEPTQDVGVPQLYEGNVGKQLWWTGVVEIMKDEVVDDESDLAVGMEERMSQLRVPGFRRMGRR
jgi:hypothetical protein